MTGRIISHDETLHGLRAESITKIDQRTGKRTVRLLQYRGDRRAGEEVEVRTEQFLSDVQVVSSICKKRGFEKVKDRRYKDCCKACGRGQSVLYANAPPGSSGREQLCPSCLLQLYGNEIDAVFEGGNDVTRSPAGVEFVKLGLSADGKFMRVRHFKEGWEWEVPLAHWRSRWTTG